jgi:hypothetical protein
MKRLAIKGLIWKFNRSWYAYPPNPWVNEHGSVICADYFETFSEAVNYATGGRR